MGINSQIWGRVGSGGGIVLFELLDGHITQEFIYVGRKKDGAGRPSGVKLGPLLPLELPINMNYLMTSLTTLIPKTTTPQAPPMVALSCQLKNSTRFTLLTLIGLLMSPPLPLESLCLPLLLVDPRLLSYLIHAFWSRVR